MVEIIADKQPASAPRLAQDGEDVQGPRPHSALSAHRGARGRRGPRQGTLGKGRPQDGLQRDQGRQGRTFAASWCRSFRSARWTIFLRPWARDVLPRARCCSVCSPCFTPKHELVQESAAAKPEGAAKKPSRRHHHQGHRGHASFALPSAAGPCPAIRWSPSSAAAAASSCIRRTARIFRIWNRNAWIPCTWNNEESKPFPAEISILGLNEKGLLAKISLVFVQQDVNINALQIKSTVDGRSQMDFTVEVRGAVRRYPTVGKLRAIDRCARSAPRHVGHGRDGDCTLQKTTGRGRSPAFFCTLRRGRAGEGRQRRKREGGELQKCGGRGPALRLYSSGNAEAGKRTAGEPDLSGMTERGGGEGRRARERLPGGVRQRGYRE